jgi:hypothetical protein
MFRNVKIFKLLGLITQEVLTRYIILPNDMGTLGRNC